MKLLLFMCSRGWFWFFVSSSFLGAAPAVFSAFFRSGVAAQFSEFVGVLGCCLSRFLGYCQIRPVVL